MFFIAGLTDRVRAVGSGQFLCPNERGARPYQLLRRRRWITLFFIPLIPLGRGQDWVQCHGCGTSYDPRVLEAAPTQ